MTTDDVQTYVKSTTFRWAMTTVITISAMLFGASFSWDTKHEDRLFEMQRAFVTKSDLASIKSDIIREIQQLQTDIRALSRNK